jgi:O-acetyl-ADP-ribose deacetylase (regulator of RNase III)
MELVRGNILDDDADAIVIPVNCVGVMGKGLALAAKKRWPEIEESYKAYCRGKVIDPGAVWVERVSDHVVIFAATKDHWKDPSQLHWIRACCSKIAYIVKGESVIYSASSIAVPALGCGLGELAWADVLPIMERHFADIDVRVYEPLEVG